MVFVFLSSVGLVHPQLQWILFSGVGGSPAAVDEGVVAGVFLSLPLPVLG